MGRSVPPHARDAAIERALVAAAEATTVEELAARALPCLRHAVGAASTLLYRYEDTGRLAPLGGELAGEIDRYTRDHVAVDPVHRFPRTLAARPRVVLATRHVDRRAYRRSQTYGEFYAGLEMEHLACAWLTSVPYAAPGMTGMLFTRPSRREDFDEHDRATLSRAVPALAAAVARALRLRELAAQRDALEALASSSSRDTRLVVDAAGRVVWASAACAPIFARTAQSAREIILQAARRTFAGAVAQPIVVRVGATRLDALLSHLTSASGARLVLIELQDAATPRRPLDELAHRHGLTNAEATVLGLLAAGTSNRAAAESLHVSIETVRTHVRRVLGKLGVRSRLEAAVVAMRAGVSRAVAGGE